MPLDPFPTSEELKSRIDIYARRIAGDLISLGDYASAIKALEILEGQMDPSRPVGLTIRSGDNLTKIAIFSAHLPFWIARCYEDLGQHDKAIPYLQRALDLTPNAPGYLNAFGVCHDRIGKFDEAQAYYERALEFDPNNPVIPANLARSLLWIDDYEGARSHLEHAASLDPSLENLVNLGGVCMELGDPAAAVASLRKAYDADPDNPDILEDLSAALIQNGERRAARRLLDAALDRDPNNVAAHNQIGILLGSKEKPDLAGALTHFQKAARLNPDIAAYRLNVGHTHLKMGNLEAAERHLRRAEKMAPNALSPQITLAEIDLEYGGKRREKAMGRLCKAYDTIAHTGSPAGFSSVLDHMEKVVDRFPSLMRPADMG